MLLLSFFRPPPNFHTSHQHSERLLVNVRRLKTGASLASLSRYTLQNEQSQYTVNAQQTDWNEPSEVFWTGQQRFRYFVSAVMLPLIALVCAYVVFKTLVQLRSVSEVGIAVAILTGWNELGYWIAFLVHVGLSAAMIRCCTSDKMVVPRYLHIVLWFAVALWLIIVGITVVKIGLLTIASAIVASTLLAAFALMGAVVLPTQSNGSQSGAGRYTILQLMVVTTFVAVLAAIGMRFPSTASVEFWAVIQLGEALFRIFMLACPILALYAYFRAACDFASVNDGR